jgi:hypothetical protein
MGTMLWLIAGAISAFLGLELGGLAAPTLGGVGASLVFLACFLALLSVTLIIIERLERRPTMMDVVVRTAYGNNPPHKTADLGQAVTLAHEDLLQEQILLADVQQHARALLNGPMPYSTHDLAASTALAFLKDTRRKSSLSKCQIGARKRVADWAKAGKVNSLLAEAFEETIRERHEIGNVRTAVQEVAPSSMLTANDYRSLSFTRAEGDYANEVTTELRREFGVENGGRISIDESFRHIIEAYKADGVPAHKAADYIIAKLKWGPKNDLEIAVQRELAQEFAKCGADFMALDPEVHFSILQEAIVFKRIPRTVEMFFDIAVQVGCMDDDDLRKSARLAEVYRTRLDILRGSGRSSDASALPPSCRRFL